MKITIGTVDQGPLFAGKHGHKVQIDLKILKQSRLMITADSGGGKTYLIKKIVEEVFGEMPIHILDPEGEFAALREHLDFFLIGKGGDVPPTVGLARAQAQKFLELRASVICDIYELRPQQRQEFVREYLEGLTDAPKEMRHPCLVIVDEAHLFAPEGGKSIAAEAMADIASRGRKRGLILIVATQRLAKLSKDVSSEMLNRLIGPTFEDVNRERAAEVLGVTKSDRNAFYDQIRILEPGHFFALGRAISKDRIMVAVGQIKSKHGEEAEKFNQKPPAPRSKVAAMLKTLKELPREEEERRETVKGLREEIRRLRADVATAKRIAVPAIDQGKTKEAIKKSESRLKLEYGLFVKSATDALKVIQKEGSKVSEEMRSLSLRVDRAIGKGSNLKLPKFARPASENDLPRETVTAVHQVAKAVVKPTAANPATVHVQRPRLEPTEPGALNRSQIAIMRALNEIAETGELAPSRSRVAFWAGASVNSSTFANNVSVLKVAGMIDYPGGGALRINQAFRDDQRFASEGALTVHGVKDRARTLLTTSCAKMLEAAIAAYPREVSKENLAEAAGASPTSSTFANNVSILKTAGLITYPQRGFVKAADWLSV